MEVCPEAELIAVEDPATVCDRAFQIGQGLKVLVREWLIQNGPEVLGGLKLGRVRGQVGEPDPIRHSQVRFGVPAGAVEPEHDDAIPSRPGLTRKQGQEPCEERLGRTAWTPRSRWTRRFRPRLAAQRRSHKATCSGGDRARSAAGLWAPTPGAGSALGRCGAHLWPRLRSACPGAGLSPQRRPAPAFLNASRSSDVAEAGWRGRGFCTDQLIALSASQPRWGKTAARPSSPAIQAATFGLVHKPPSGGGSSRRALSLSSRSGLRTEGLVPFRRRRSPRACGPWAL